MLGNVSKRLLLASGSPRRRELIDVFEERVGFVSSSSDEPSPLNGETPDEYVLRVALAKAQNVAKKSYPAVLISADTVVVFKGEILGKPLDYEEASTTLGRLRGTDHQVVTGVTVLDSETGALVKSSTSTCVIMRKYSTDEIAQYVATGKPLDKAGSYGVQDHEFHPAQAVKGCYLNVVGFPLCTVTTLLGKMGVSVNIRPEWRPPEQCLDCPFQPGRQVDQR